MNILGNWSSCGNCHAGLGAVPEATASQEQLKNIDCLLCHQVGYKRKKVDGVFVPDAAAMAPMTLDQAVRMVHKPVRANCLQCHAKAGGGDAYKRGDLALAHGNTTDTTFDRHMATTGENFSCLQCHKVSNHRIAGRGSDIAPTDLDFPMGCSTAECHPTKGSPAGHNTTAVNSHVARVACQTCHIKTYGKNASDTAATEATEVHRDWTKPVYNSTTGLWHPESYLQNNLLPAYKFWNKYSTNYLLYDVTSPNPVTGNYTLSRPVGSISDLTTASKLYPFKFKTGFQPIATRLNVLIAIDTSVYWTGSFATPGERVAAAVASGLTNMGFSNNEPYQFVTTESNQLISHGVPPASQTLTCNECHVSRTQMNLPNLGYQLKNTPQMICTQCHGMEDPMSFNKVHQKHVIDKKQGCSWCHSFSRPERNLNENYQAYVLTVNRPGTGNGTVTSADGSIVCGTDCTETYGANTMVTLTATPALDATFSGWSGACSGKSATCTITMNSFKEVSATFTPIEIVDYILTVNKPGTGNGTVTSADGGINCGTDCTEAYGVNTRVTLTATPAQDATFSGWSGACTGTSTTCSVTMNASREVSATFIPAQPLLYLARDYLNFGKVRVGNTRAKNLLIKNKGNTDLLIVGVSANNPAFTTGWVSQVVIPPRKSYRLKVSFTPTSIGVTEGLLSIISNDANSPTVVRLSGEGR